MVKLKIPSKFLRIIGGPFKGYDAEFKDRLRQGEFLVVVVGATGNVATIPIQHIVFVMEDGRLLRYAPVQTGFSLVEIGKEDSGEIISIREVPGSPSKVSPIFIPQQNLEDNDIQNILFEESENTGDYDSGIYNKDDEDSPLIQNYEEISKKYRNTVALGEDDTTVFLSELFTLLGFEMDNVSINHHSKIVSSCINNEILRGIDVKNEEIKKSLIMAYVFVHINNMNLGYPINIPGVKMRPNDDPEFIVRACLKQKFSKRITNIDSQIKIVCEILKTAVVPSYAGANEFKGISNRFGLLRISSSTKKSEPIISNIGRVKMMRFPIYEETTKIQSEIKTKNTIIEKINKKIKESSDFIEKDILTNLKNNFDSYIKGPLFKKLNNDPELLESKITIPYIREYKVKLDLEEDKFYRDANNTVVKNSKIPVVKRVSDDILKKNIMDGFNEKLTMASEKTDNVKKNIIKSIVKNSEAIVKMDVYDIQRLNTELITADENTKQKILAMIDYRKNFIKIYEKNKKVSEDKKFSRKRKIANEEVLSKKFERLNTESKKTFVVVRKQNEDSLSEKNEKLNTVPKKFKRLNTLLNNF